MKAMQLQKKMSDEEYFLFEEKSDLRHEMIDGNLHEMGGISIFHSDIVSNLIFLFRTLLKESDWKTVFENFKIKTPQGNYFYPDLAIWEPQIEKYYSENPVLLVEVLSNSTRKY